MKIGSIKNIFSFPLKALSTLCKALLDFIYPPYCLLCQCLLDSGRNLICSHCYETLPRFPEDHNIVAEITRALNTSIYIDKIFSTWEFSSPCQSIVHHFKYKNKSWLAYEVGGFIAQTIKINPYFKTVDVIIPVPLHKSRQRERGYNQSERLGQAIADTIKIPLDETILLRKKKTRTQTKLNFQQRLSNVSDAFVVKKNDAVVGRSIMLVDDVVTTGSTINACAKQLKLAGAKEVIVVSAARA